MRHRPMILLMACAIILALALGPPARTSKTSLKKMVNIAKMRPNSAMTSSESMATITSGATVPHSKTVMTPTAADQTRTPAINWATDGAHRARSGPMQAVATTYQRDANRHPAIQPAPALRC